MEKGYKKTEYKNRIFVKKIGEEYRPWESLSAEEKIEIGQKLTDRALRAAGYAPIDDKTA